MPLNECFIDANVLIDHILAREPFVRASDSIFDLIEKRMINGSISIISISTASYYAEKIYSGSDSKKLFKWITSFCRVLPAVGEDFNWAISSQFNDLEDAIQNHIAESNGCTTIITRNKKDFKKSNLAILTPDEFLATL